jgi:hypothetical protein
MGFAKEFMLFGAGEAAKRSATFGCMASFAGLDIGTEGLALPITTVGCFAFGELTGSGIKSEIKNKILDATELTQDKGYRGREVDVESNDTLTHIRGYRSNEYEFRLQTRVSREDSRPL